MGKKKKIREEYKLVFKSGDQKLIKKMLKKYPWLFDEISQDMDQGMLKQFQIIAALGVMEDELGGSVPIDQIIFCLGVDFKIHKSEEEVKEILNNVENLDLIKKDSNGWTLTSEGEKICDDFLNKNIENIEL